MLHNGRRDSLPNGEGNGQLSRAHAQCRRFCPALCMINIKSSSNNDGVCFTVVVVGCQGQMVTKGKSTTRFGCLLTCMPAGKQQCCGKQTCQAGMRIQPLLCASPHQVPARSYQLRHSSWPTHPVAQSALLYIISQNEEGRGLLWGLPAGWARIEQHTTGCILKLLQQQPHSASAS